MSEKSEILTVDGVAGEGALGESSLSKNPAMQSATLIAQMAPGMFMPYEYGGVEEEITAHVDTAWIGTALMHGGVYDVYGPDSVKFLESICVNKFSKLDMEGMRHAVICNDKGQLLMDGTCIRIGEDRYRTWFLNPPIQYLVESSDMDVHGEVMTGKIYFIQIAGEKSLQILEDACQTDLHGLKFTKHCTVDMDGHEVMVMRLGMSGDLAYEIHGPIEDYPFVYNKVWESGQKFGARKLGAHAYNEFNHTEGGFPNIHLHYPLPWYESGEDMKQWLLSHPGLGGENINRKLTGSSTDLEERFVTPYDLGWGFLVKFNHEFTGKAALEKIAQNPPRTCVTLEWNPEDVGKVFAALNTPGGERVDNIAFESDTLLNRNAFNGWWEYRADEVYAGDRKIGITSGRIHSYPHNSMISLGFISPEFSDIDTEVKILWGTPGTKQMWVRALVKQVPYNSDLVSNRDRDVEDIPHFKK